MTRTIVLAACTLLGGCSYQAAYNTLQVSGRSLAACEAIQNNADAARCEADFTKPYRMYERERHQVLTRMAHEGSDPS